jgi:hypothetical protein
MLFITQPANGQIIVESPINEGHVRIYDPKQKTQTPAGQGGTITMTTQWQGRRLAGNGTLVTAAGASATVSESYAVNDAGKVLTVEVTAMAPERKHSVLVFDRVTSVGGCQTWPTPCKR